MNERFKDDLIVVRGAGDLATAVIARLSQAGFPVVALDTARPTVIRRTVALAEAIVNGSARVETTRGVYCTTEKEIKTALKNGEVAVCADPHGKWIQALRPKVVVDAIIAKKNLGTTKDMADVVVALGPGFTAGKDCDAVVETQRGHNLGRVIYDGSAAPNTGVPGMIGGYPAERVIHAPAAGTIAQGLPIGSHVSAGQTVAVIENGHESVPVRAKIAGVLRGMIADGSVVPEGFKIADVDPRDQASYCQSISDKGRAIAGGVLEAVLHLLN